MKYITIINLSNYLINTLLIKQVKTSHEKHISIIRIPDIFRELH